MYLMISGAPVLVKACEAGHMGIVKHLTKLEGVKDFDGQDGINALAQSIGQLDPDLVNILADPEVQIKTPEFLCHIIDELYKEIYSEKSDSKRKKMESLKHMLAEQKIHERFCKKPSCGKISTTSVDDKYDCVLLNLS